MIRPRNRAGMALAATIFSIVMIGLITAGAWTVTELDLKATHNRVDAATALMLAHTAETHALSLLRSRLKDTTFHRLLRGYDNTPGTTDDGLLAGYPALGDSLSVPASGRVYPGYGTYYIRILDDPQETDGLPFTDANRRLLIHCRGVAANGSTADINIIVGNFELPAVAVDGSVEIDGGTMTVLSACGGIHANGSVFGAGALVATQVTASGTVSANVVGTKLSGQPSLDIPNLSPADFCGSASYVYIGTGSTDYEGTSPNGVWRPRSSDIANGKTYCISGDVEFAEDFGGPGTPRTASIIAYGSIKVGGKKVWLTAAHPDGFALLAGGDLHLEGEAGFTGLVYGGGQCYVADKLTVNGQFLCKNKSSPPGADLVSGGVVFSGTPIFNFSCNNILSTVFGIVAWYPTIGS